MSYVSQWDLAGLGQTGPGDTPFWDWLGEEWSGVTDAGQQQDQPMSSIPAPTYTPPSLTPEQAATTPAGGDGGLGGMFMIGLGVFALLMVMDKKR